MSKEKKKFKDTGIVKFLTDKIPAVLPLIMDKVDDVFPPAGLITMAVNALGKGKLSPEDELKMDSLLLEYEQTERKDYLADIANSRDMNVRIQETEHASWLAKNAAYILDFGITASFIVMLFMIFYKVVPVDNKEIFYTAFGLLGGFVGATMNFHRGSSKGSEDKQRMLDKMIRK